MEHFPFLPKKIFAWGCSELCDKNKILQILGLIFAAIFAHLKNLFIVTISGIVALALPRIHEVNILLNFQRYFPLTVMTSVCCEKLGKTTKPHWVLVFISEIISKTAKAWKFLDLHYQLFQRKLRFYFCRFAKHSCSQCLFNIQVYTCFWYIFGPKIKCCWTNEVVTSFWVFIPP